MEDSIQRGGGRERERHRDFLCVDGATFTYASLKIIASDKRGVESLSKLSNVLKPTARGIIICFKLIALLKHNVIKNESLNFIY